MRKEVRRDMGTRQTLQSAKIRFGKRTFFFDVYQSASAKKYLKITQSEFEGEGKERKYNSFVLFPDNIKEFQAKIEEIAGALQ